MFALVIPYAINHAFTLVYKLYAFYSKFEKERLAEKGGKIGEVIAFQAYYNKTYYLVLCQDATNDFYHASNFYLYLWLSSKFRDGFMRQMRWLACRFTRQTSTSPAADPPAASSSNTGRRVIQPPPLAATGECLL